MPIQMTRAEYETKYGRKPNVPPKVVTPTIPKEDPGFIERVNTDLQQRGSNVYDAIKGEGQYAGESSIRRGFEATNEAFKGITHIGYEALPKVAREVLTGNGTPIEENTGVDNITGKPLDSFTKLIQSKGIGGAIGEGFKALTDKVADIPALQNWVINHPEASKNLEEILGTSGAAGGIAGTILTTNAATQLAQKAVNKGLDVGGKVFEKTGEVLKKGGEKLNASAYKPTADEARLLQSNQIKVKYLEDQLSQTAKGTPEYEALSKELATTKASAPTLRSDTALQRGISGTEKQIGVESGVEKMKLWKDKIEPALRGNKTTISKDEIFSKAEERIANEIDPSRQASYRNALDSLKEDYANIDKYTLADANKLKTALDKFTPPKIFKGQDVASEIKTLKADMADAIRAKTYNSITDTNIKADYRDYANLKQLENVGIKAITEGGKRGGFGNFWSTVKDELTVPVKTIGGKVLYRVGNKLEFIGDKGIKTFGDHLNDIGFNFRPLKETASSPSTNSGNNILADKLKNTNIQNEGRAIENSLETLSEQSQGWQPGMKKLFDDALYHGDALTVRALIKENAVPPQILKSFAKNIDKLLKGK